MKWYEGKIGLILNLISIFLFIVTIGGWIVDRALWRDDVNDNIIQINEKLNEAKERDDDIADFVTEQLKLNGGIIMFMQLQDDEDE